MKKLIALALLFFTPFQALAAPSLVCANGKYVPIHCTYNLSVAPITQAAYVEIVHSLPATISGLQAYLNNPQSMYFAFGAPGHEVIEGIIFPGGNGLISFGAGVQVPAGTRIAVKTIYGPASTGELDINFMH